MAFPGGPEPDGRLPFRSVQLLLELASRSPRGSSGRSSGVVMNVVTSAMITIIVNRVGEMTPRSSPMLRTISSIRPRVFISTPSAADSRQPGR